MHCLQKGRRFIDKYSITVYVRAAAVGAYLVRQSDVDSRTQWREKNSSQLNNCSIKSSFPRLKYVHFAIKLVTR